MQRAARDLMASMACETDGADSGDGCDKGDGLEELAEANAGSDCAGFSKRALSRE